MTKEELLQRLTDIEWDDFEVKEALDKMPDNVWETVSAFCNTSGGWIVFGIKQKGKRFEVQGVNNGEKTESDFLESDIDSSTVTYFRPKLGCSDGGSTDPKTDPKKIDVGNKIISIVRSSPNITKEEIANLCGMSVSGVKYHLEKLRKSGKLEWQGHSRTGKWVIKY